MNTEGRERSPEQEADEIMNQSDESVEDLEDVAGTEIDEGDDEMEDLDFDEDFDSESDDDGGDYSE